MADLQFMSATTSFRFFSQNSHSLHDFVNFLSKNNEICVFSPLQENKWHHTQAIPENRSLPIHLRAHRHTNTHQIHIKGSDNDSHTIDFVWTINSACLSWASLRDTKSSLSAACVCVCQWAHKEILQWPTFYVRRVSEWAGTRFVLLRFIGFWRTHNAQKDTNTNDNNNFMNWNNSDFYGHCFISLFLCRTFSSSHWFPVVHRCAYPLISLWRDFSMICQFVPTLLFYLHSVWHLFRLIIS